MKRTTYILGGLAVLAVVAFYTVANRRWWFKRVNERWSYFTTKVDEKGETYITTVNLPENMSTLEVAQAYFRGREGWTRKTKA